MIEDGIHFGLREAEYFALPAISASGIKNLLISPVDYWARCPWLNKNYKDVKTEARVIGSAYHKRILEGKEEFYSKYGVEFQAPEKCIRTVDEIKEELGRLGIIPPKGAKKDELSSLLPHGTPVYDRLKMEHERKNFGKTLLSPDLIESIEIANAMIEMSPTAGKCFKGGYPEVTIIWTDEDGIRFKARLDYLKVGAISDLKTFANVQDKSIERAIYSVMAGRKYFLQATHYLNAVDKAKESAKEGKIFGDHDPEWMKQFIETKEHGCYFCFQQKGIAPLARVMKFPRTGIYNAAQVMIEEAVMKYRQSVQEFGDDPWVDTSPITELEDGLYPVYAMEI